MEQLRILIMDDEIYAGDNNPSIQAEEQLKSLGHHVETTDKMSVVLSSVKNRYFDVYVLDVDMSFVKDEIEEANGTTIGKILRERNSFYNILIFSARGGVKDWFTAANYHFQGYIYKGDNGVDRLAKHISAIARSKKKLDFSLEKNEYNNRAIVYYNPKTPAGKISLENVKKIINDVLPGADISVHEKLSDMKDNINKQKPAIALMLHGMFQDSEKTIQLLTEIMGNQPFPHIIIAVDSNHGGTGAEANQSAILNLVNARPFKLLDISQPASEEILRKMVAGALEWYGKDEIFEYPGDFKEFYGYPLSSDDLETIKGADDYDDDLDYPDYENDKQDYRA